MDTTFEQDKDMKLPEATAAIAKALRTDYAYFNTWQSNIAMAMVDEFQKIKEERGLELAMEDLTGIFTRGAKRFLNLLSK